jgi:acyl-CoA synthetase (NDP forming)
MARKKAIWKELGLKEVKSPSGNRKGFIDKEGNYISERQFRKEIALTPMKGSQGYKERQAAKAKGIDFRPETPKRIMSAMKEAAKIPGMTIEEFTKGHTRDLAYSERRTRESHNRFIDKQRREAIEFKRQTGTMTEKQADVARRDLERQIKAREKALELRDKLDSGKVPREKRAAMEKKYREEAAKVRAAQAKLEKKGIVIMDDKVSAESLRYGYYH